MAMRRMRVTFDIDMSTFLALLAEGNNSMKIDILGDAQQPVAAALRKLNGHKPPPKQLEASKRRQVRPIRKRPKGAPTIYAAMLAFFAKHKDRAVTTKELQPLVVGIGAVANSVSPQLVRMQSEGFIKRIGSGEYKITAKGVQKVAS